MVCPKCGADIDDTCEECYNCKMEFKHLDSEIVSENTENNVPIKMPKKPKTTLIKLIVIATISLVLIILIVVIFISLFGKNGEKIAAKLGEKVGSDIVLAEENAKVHLSVQSHSNALNKQADFNYIYESTKIIKVDGIKVPKWTIKIVMKDTDVFSVSYRNFNEQKKYYKGEKLKKPINIDGINLGINKTTVEGIFNIDPMSITYYEDTTEYCYMYYFINGDKDEERREVIITFDDTMKVIKTEDVDLSINNNNVH